MNQDDIRDLAAGAIKAREYAYAPYSNFTVGAALLTADGTLITGSNVENAAYPAGLCAERTAVFYAVAHGHRGFRALAVSGGQKDCPPEDYCMPCGMCLQVLSEFCGEEFDIFIVKSETDFLHLELKDLLPHAFTIIKEKNIL